MKMKLKEIAKIDAYCPTCSERTEWKYRFDQPMGNRTIAEFDCTKCRDTLSLGSLMGYQRSPVIGLLKELKRELAKIKQ